MRKNPLKNESTLLFSLRTPFITQTLSGGSAHTLLTLKIYPYAWYKNGKSVQELVMLVLLLFRPDTICIYSSHFSQIFSSKILFLTATCSLRVVSDKLDLPY